MTVAVLIAALSRRRHPLRRALLRGPDEALRLVRQTFVTA
jgi:hypothetical protein